ncbi:MAG: metallophosphoesterase, partial [Deltaproteobacteria bacterium]|nr:metallophosphoesterase [Deltaproteobacteria bacterium]
MRIFALSDIHADYSENMEWVSGLSAVDFTDDVLLLAGDISHKLDLLKWTLELLRSKFARLFFVPGNHDLWVRGNGCADSIEKYRIIMATCAEMDVLTRPTQLGSSGGGPWVVPLASWYVKPEESAASLYVEKKGEDPRLKMWVDDRAVVWPALEDGVTAAAFFHALNRCDEVRPSDGPVIS